MEVRKVIGKGSTGFTEQGSGGGTSVRSVTEAGKEDLRNARRGEVWTDRVSEGRVLYSVEKGKKGGGKKIEPGKSFGDADTISQADKSYQGFTRRGGGGHQKNVEGKKKKGESGLRTLVGVVVIHETRT